MFLKLWAVVVTALILYFVLPILVFTFIKSKKTKRIIANSLFIIYVGILLIGVWAKVMITSQGVKIIFDFTYTAQKTINCGFARLRTLDILINLVMLIPIGLILSINTNKSFIKTMALGAVVGVLCGVIIEVGQFVLPVKRYTQLSDVVLNTISVLFGVVFGQLLKKIENRVGKAVCQ